MMRFAFTSALASSPAKAGAQLPRTIKLGADRPKVAARDWTPASAGEEC